MQKIPQPKKLCVLASMKKEAAVFFNSVYSFFFFIEVYK